MYSRCPICIDFFTPNDVVALRCGHTFHEECLRRWMGRSMTCSTCRFRIQGPQDVIKLTFEYGHNGPVTDGYKELVAKIDDFTADFADRMDNLEDDVSGKFGALKTQLQELHAKLDALKLDAQLAKAERGRILAEIGRLRRSLEEAKRAPTPNRPPIRSAMLPSRPPAAAAIASTGQPRPSPAPAAAVRPGNGQIAQASNSAAGQQPRIRARTSVRPPIAARRVNGTNQAGGPVAKTGPANKASK